MFKPIPKLISLTTFILLLLTPSAKSWEYSEKESNIRYTNRVIEDIEDKYNSRVGIYKALRDRAKRNNQELVIQQLPIDEKVIHNPTRISSYLELVKSRYWRVSDTPENEHTLVRDYYRHCNNQQLQGIFLVHEKAERGRDPLARGGKQISYHQADALYKLLFEIMESKSGYCSTIQWDRITFR